MTSEQILLSIVIPVFNEAESIGQLHNEVVAVCTQKDYNYEIIIIDDGSTDGTDKIVKSLSRCFS